MKLKIINAWESSQNYGAGWGTDASIEYECPCGKNTVSESNEQVPGFRDHVIYCHCPECDKKYDFAFGGIATKKKAKTTAKQKEYYKQWYQKNKDRLIRERREYQKEYHREWYQKNKDKAREYYRRWYQKKKTQEELEK